MAAWDEPDEWELGMLGGHDPGEAPELHRIHAERRWGTAKHAYRQEHPDLAEQEFREIVESVARHR
jgi:hypothetical protein